MREMVALVNPVLLITSAVALISASRKGTSVLDWESAGPSRLRGVFIGVAACIALRMFSEMMDIPALVPVMNDRSAEPTAIDAPSATPAFFIAVLRWCSPASLSQVLM